MIGWVALLIAVPLNAGGASPNLISDADAAHTPKALRPSFLQTHVDEPLAKPAPRSRTRGLQSAMRARLKRRPHSLLEKRHDSVLLSHHSEKEDAEENRDKCGGQKFQWGMKMMKKCAKSFGPESTWTYTDWHDDGRKNRQYCQTGYQKCMSHRYVMCCTRTEGTANLKTYCKLQGLEHKEADDPACKVEKILTPVKPIVKCIAALADCLGSAKCEALATKSCMQSQAYTTTITTTITKTPEDDHIHPELASEIDADDDADDSEGTPDSPSSAASDNLPVPGPDAGAVAANTSGAPPPTSTEPRGAKLDLTPSQTPSVAANVSAAPPPTSIDPSAAKLDSTPPASQITGTPPVATSATAGIAAGPAAGTAAGAPAGLASAPAPAASMVSGTGCPRGGPSLIPPTQDEVCSHFYELLNDLYSRVDVLKGQEIVQKDDLELYEYMQKLNSMGTLLQKFQGTALCGKTGANGKIMPPMVYYPPTILHKEPPAHASLSPLPQWVSGEAQGQDEATQSKEGTDKDSDQGNETEDQGNETEDDEDEVDDDSDNEDAVVAVDQVHLSEMVSFLGHDYLESVQDVETKVQPFDLKWWRYRWEFSAFEGVVLTPAILFWYLIQKFYVKGVSILHSGKGDAWKPMKKVRMHHTLHAFLIQGMAVVVGLFLNWVMSAFPDPNNNLYDKLHPINKWLFAPGGVLGLDVENLPFKGTSYAHTIAGIMYQTLAALACWLVYVIVILKNFQGRIRAYNTQEYLEMSGAGTDQIDQEYKRYEDIFIDKAEAWLDQLKKESPVEAKEAQKSLKAIGMHFDGFQGHTSSDRKDFRFNAYLEHALIEASQTLVVPQLGSCVGLASFGLFAAFYCYKTHWEFAYFYKYIAFATGLVFAFSKFVASRLESHTFMTSPEGAPMVAPMPWVRPERLIVALQVFAYLLCYSSTRVLLSAEMWQSNPVFVGAVLVFFLATLGLVWYPGSSMVAEAIVQLAVPPHLRPEDLNRYAIGYSNIQRGSSTAADLSEVIGRPA